MDKLQLLAVALGFASLAGINLYLTVFATGLAINLGWVVLDPAFASLQLLGHPAVVGVAGVLYFLEFFADKINWIDSLWDSVHTIIRPIGAALLAVQVLGKTNEVFDFTVILLAGGAALVTHGLKAGTRLVTNASPEPFTNIALSLGEDVGVLGGLALIHYNPLLALAVFVAIIAAIIWFAPTLLRAIRARLWLIWRKLNAPASGPSVDESLPADLPAEYDILFNRLTVLGERIAWAVPCVSGGARRLPANLRGYLVATREEPRKLYFVAKRSWRQFEETLELTGYEVTHESRFLSENLVLQPGTKRPKYTFLFDRTQAARVRKVAEAIRARLETREAATTPSPAETSPSSERVALPENVDIDEA